MMRQNWRIKERPATRSAELSPPARTLAAWRAPPSTAARNAAFRAPSGTLVVIGGQSAEQVRLRAERLAPGALRVPVVAETDLELILDTIDAQEPEACVIDSVQTLSAPGSAGAPGSVSQVREGAGR